MLVPNDSDNGVVVATELWLSVRWEITTDELK